MVVAAASGKIVMVAQRRPLFESNWVKLIFFNLPTFPASSLSFCTDLFSEAKFSAVR